MQKENIKGEIKARLQYGDRDRIALLAGCSVSYVYQVLNREELNNEHILKYAWQAAYDRPSFDEAYHKERLRLSEMERQQAATVTHTSATA